MSATGTVDPQDELARFGIVDAELLSATPPADFPDKFRRLMEFQIERAETYYAEALRQLPERDRKPQRAGLIMAAIYRATLTEIKRDANQVLSQRVSLSPLRKLWLAGLTWIKG